MRPSSCHRGQGRAALAEGSVDVAFARNVKEVARDMKDHHVQAVQMALVARPGRVSRVGTPRRGGGWDQRSPDWPASYRRRTWPDAGRVHRVPVQLLRGDMWIIDLLLMRGCDAIVRLVPLRSAAAVA